MHNALPLFVSCTTSYPSLYHVQRFTLLVVNLSSFFRDDTCFMFVVPGEEQQYLAIYLHKLEVSRTFLILLVISGREKFYRPWI